MTGNALVDLLILCGGCIALGWAGGFMHGMEHMHTFWALVAGGHVSIEIALLGLAWVAFLVGHHFGCRCGCIAKSRQSREDR